MRRLAAAMLLLVACSGPGNVVGDAGTAGPDGAGPDGAGPDAATPPGWHFETIERRTVTLLEVPREVELVRAHRPDGERSYLLYVPALRPEAPLVVTTQPYAGIDWTGEEVDARWAALGPGLHPDLDAPAHDGDDLIAYEPQTVQAAVDASVVWVANEFAVVHAYGRFYAGGSIEDDVLDAAAPYHFARTRDELDPARIGTWGGSWGGFMALFGASRAPDDAKPAAVAALWGPSDFTDLWAYTDALPRVYPQPAQAEAFFSPYRRRIAGATGGPAPREGFAPYDREALCAGLGMPVLSPHDDWDTLIPVEQTRALEGCAGVEPLYWHRQTPIDYAEVMLDHGAAFRSEPGYPSALTMSQTFLLVALADETASPITIASEEALVMYLQLVRDEQLAGGDASDALPRLRELALARVRAFTPAGTVEPSADLLARAASTAYGRPYDAASLRAQLETGLPTP